MDEKALEEEEENVLWVRMAMHSAELGRKGSGTEAEHPSVTGVLIKQK